MPIKQLELDLIPQLHKVEIRAKRKILSRVLEGSWVSLLKGRGMEFAGFRSYTYGDDASRIDWNASLRANETLVREFEEYKTVNVFFIIDISDSMLFTSTEKLKCEFAAEMAFNLAAAIIDSGNSVGYAIFSDQVHAKQFPSIGREVIYRMATDLQKEKFYGGKRNFKHAMNMIKSFLTQRTLIILVSDYIDLPENWERYINYFATENDLIGLMVRDPNDSKLPPDGMQALISAPSDKAELLLVDLKQYEKAYQLEVQREEKYISMIFEKRRAGFLKVDSQKDPYDQLIRYFKRRSKLVAGSS